MHTHTQTSGHSRNYWSVGSQQTIREDCVGDADTVHKLSGKCKSQTTGASLDTECSVTTAETST